MKPWVIGYSRSIYRYIVDEGGRAEGGIGGWGGRRKGREGGGRGEGSRMGGGGGGGRLIKELLQEQNYKERIQLKITLCFGHKAKTSMRSCVIGF